MKQKLLNLFRLRAFALIAILYAGVSSAWGVTGTIKFGNNGTKINSTSVKGDDDLGNTWTISTVMNETSFTQSTDYSQIGSSSKPATSITFTTTLPSSVNITSFSAKFGGYNSTAGDVTLKVGETSVGTGSLNGTNDVVVSSTSSSVTGTTLTVTLTNIAKGVKAYNISYTYSTGGQETPVCEMPTFSPGAGAIQAGTKVDITQDNASLILYTINGTDPSYENSIGTEYTEPITITKATTIKAIAVDDEGNESSVASASYTINVTAPSLSVNGGEVYEGTEIEIYAAEGASVFYTVDGTDPTNESTPYTTPIAINNNLTLKAIAYDSYGNASSVTTRSFTVKVTGGIEITPNYAFFGLSQSTSGDAKDEVTGTTTDGVTLTYTRNDGSLYLSSTAMRFYKSNTLKIDAPSGKSIVKVVFTQSNAQTDDMTSDPTGYESTTKTWIGNAISVTFSRPNNALSYLQFTKITVVLADNEMETVAAPQFSPVAGEYTEAQDVTITCSTSGAKIYYTTNGETPTTGSMEYTAPISVSSNTTIKAIAAKDGMNNSPVVEAIYTILSGGEQTSDWVKVNLADLTVSDVFVIVGNNGSNYAISNDNGTGSAPTAIAVTISGDYLTGTVADNIKWTVSGNATDGYAFYPNGSTETWLYCNTTAASSSNNNMRVGTGSRKIFKLSDDYLVTNDDNVDRYLSIYSNQDWRGYINTDNAVAMAFYKYVGAPLPVITASDVEIAYDATSGSISYVVENSVDGGTLTAATEADWLTIGTVAAAAVSFTATVNTAITPRTATVTLTYTNGTNTITKNINVTQAGNPNGPGSANDPYTVAEALDVIAALADGGKTETEVYVTGIISDIKEVAVFDPAEGTGYGNAIYFISDDGTTTSHLEVYHGFYLDNTKFTAEDQIEKGDKVVICGKLQKYKSGNNITPEVASNNYLISQAVKVTIAAATDGKGNYYGTVYYSCKNLKIPAGITASGVSVNGSQLVIGDAIGANDVIGAGTAVLLKATAAGTYEFTVTDDDATPLPGTNQLLGTDQGDVWTTGGDTYYMLSLNKNSNPESVGFYYGAEGGARFKNGAHKAYLAVPSNAKSGFVFNDIVTDINRVAVETGNAAIYNLNGQRVDKNYKGVVIVNGKKMINK